jgi:biopolymer transport protein ExbD
MRLDLPTRPPPRAISLTPLIDVVFILLLFFLLASQFQQWRTLTVNAPATARHQPVGEARAMLIRVHDDGSVDLNGDAVSHAELRAALVGHLVQDPELSVVVQPSADVALQPLVSVIDQIVAAGVTELSLQ